MAEFQIGDRCFFWNLDTPPIYGQVIKMDHSGNKVLIRSDNGSTYFIPKTEVIKVYGRGVR